MTSIGVSGHRWFGSPAAVMQGVDQALATIGACFPRPFTLYSCLADGADRLVARRASLILGARLVALLPMPQAEYRQDFSPKSQAEFTTLLQQAAEVIELPGLAPRSAAYEAAGRYMLAHSDVLLVIWDGQPARGQGGTGQMVAEARQLGLPLAWVLAKNRHFSLTGKPGRLTLERFPE